MDQTASSSKIPNHFASTLSELDLRMVHSVPPGGNWKDIPKEIPSQRLTQIRESYARGEGSRSTYYGRLKPESPSYTINTYFQRPGNGCHIHYEQHRTLSQREAARLQSFPDNFVFYGSKTKINQQIGNAVPPLLAYQIAKAIPFAGMFVDLFCGAGGLSLGFVNAGWQPVIGNDIESTFLQTYSANIHEQVICGDIRDGSVFQQLVDTCESAKTAYPDLPLLVLGGPPCQGFSTAGNRRSMQDERNWLFRSYKEFLQRVQPSGFIFENVAGLLSMERGQVFAMIKDQLSEAMGEIVDWKINAEEYAVPQRRTRIFLLGTRNQDFIPTKPEKLTQFDAKAANSNAISVADAISDLPPLDPSEDGSEKPYRSKAQSLYQKLMRGLMSEDDFLAEIKKR